MAPAIVLLHGFTHTGESWNPVLAALGERYRASAPDLRGHGASSALRPVTLDAVLADLTALPLDAFTLVGYSMGGRIALHAALALGDRVKRLVVIGASPGIDDPVEREARIRADEALADELEQMSIEELARRWALTPVLDDQPYEVRERAHADRLRNSPSGLAAALRGLGAGALPSLWHRLDELPMPVTLVVGERDDKFRALAERMGDRIHAADVVVVPGAGHAAHLEAPELCAAIIAAA